MLNEHLDFEVRHPRWVKPKLQNGKKYSQNTTIFISYEWVDHIAVYKLHVSASIGHRQVVILPVILYTMQLYIIQLSRQIHIE